MIWIALCGLTADAALTREPYLQSTTPTQTTIVWSTVLPALSAEVKWGTSPTALTNTATASSSALNTQHEATLSGLSPDTVYYYEVRNNGTVEAGGPDYWVHTPPPVGDRARTRMWVVGDSGTGDQVQRSVRDAMLGFTGDDGPDLYLHVGDMAYGDGTWLQFTTNFYAPYSGILRHTTVWPALGNHEGKSSSSGSESGPYYDGYVLPRGGQAGGVASGTEAYYSFDYANAHIIVLDSHDSPRNVGGAMLTWLAADLAANSAEWTFAYWHHPPYTKGSHDSDYEQAHIDMRENALPILEAGGVDMVFGGHSHTYERSYLLDGGYQTPSTSFGILDADDGDPSGDGPYSKANIPNDGAVYFVAGHGGKDIDGVGGHPLNVFTEFANGSLIVDMHENRLDVSNVRADGAVTDRVTLIKGDGLVVISPNGDSDVLANDTVAIDWATVGPTATVDIDYTCDGGLTWTPIAAGVPNSGTHAWSTPDIATNQARVRVTDADDAAIWDDSNARFGVGMGRVELIGSGALWSYDDSGTDHGAGWNDDAFDDSAWATGPAQLGFGDGDEATTITDRDPNDPSVYFRKTVNLSTPVTGGELAVTYDDGIIVYVNGTEVLSRNVTGDDYGDWAISNSGDNATYTTTIAGGPFVLGDNIVAAMVKQHADDSSDLSFDLRLSVDLTPSSAEQCESDGDADTDADADADTDADADADSDADSDVDTFGEDPVGGCACATGGGPGGWLFLFAFTAIVTRRR